ncbi:MAG: pyruvate:ferredoxin (flavodoxin) oxidoreductase [Verrucomicrobia bacterium]|nr:MAG: pyruvate:ferredoxin (flavodoxin) oxidoreductase [Verrucomicrobiota bacterium]
MKKLTGIMDGNEATAYIAHKTNEVCAIYPITPSSPMGEFSDEWSAGNKKNIWGTIPLVAELQSEGGASGAVHGALQTGALTTTFTASQGLLLMIPNMYKIAGELTATVFHVTARSLACQALSIFGDHSDVLACRATGFAFLCSASVQEAMDMALIAQAATLESRVPFLHFFDGFRTSHEVQKVNLIPEDQIRAMINDELVFAHRARALNPEKPVLRGTAQNPDVYFQGRETVNPFYDQVPGIVEKVMAQFGKIVGRHYKLFDYSGAPDAERVIVVMGSGAEAALEAVNFLAAKGEKVGVLRVHLYRPFSAKHFLTALPKSVKALAVLDRTKEPGCAGEPMYQDVLTVLGEAQQGDALPFAKMPRVIGGRYGLSSKEFTPAMVKAVFDELAKPQPKNHFTVGINDDVGHTSLTCDPKFITESPKVTRAMFFGLGADGTVGANKNTIKIIGDETDLYTQGYFVYDSKKSGSRTVSHLRFGPEPILSTYLVQAANFIGCHQFNFLEKTDVLKYAAEGAVFLLNSPYSQQETWERLPRSVQQQIIDRKVKFYVIDAYKVAAATGMGTRINTIMQTCFFAISGVLPKDEAIEKIKGAIKKTYGKKGEDVVKKNFEAVDQTLANLHAMKVPATATSKVEMPPPVPAEAPDYVKNVLGKIMSDQGDELPVSAMPVDGTFPTGTTQWEKRNISLSVPVWDPKTCIQCGNCAYVCPHACIRMKTVSPTALAQAPQGFVSTQLKGKDAGDKRYILQVAVEDCTGCALCVQACPAKNKEQVSRRAINMEDKDPILARERANFSFFQTLPENDRTTLDMTSLRDVQFLQPLFEFSGACGGCGETPYVKLASQLFGDRMIVANATGCSSIYGGNLPTTPWAKNKEGRGPAWSNSLFEDNAEFGFGYSLTVEKHRELAGELLKTLAADVGETLVSEILGAKQATEAEIAQQRQRVATLKGKLATSKKPEARNLLTLADMLVKRSVWIMGGDGWAYDIGYGGLDHVLASGRKVNVLVLDTEVYSNTGGQMSKSTPIGAVAKFAAGGKRMGKKDLGMIAMSYGNVYVAKIAMGASPRQTLRAFVEADAYPGPSLIIAYSHCIAHGIDMINGLRQQKLAVDSGHWPLYRYNPLLAAQGQNPLQLDSKQPSIPLKDYIYTEIRYKMLTHSNPEVAKQLLEDGQKFVNDRWAMYEKLAANGGAVAPVVAG